MTLKKKLEAALAIENEEEREKTLAALFARASDDMLLPGQNKDFDLAYMEATKYLQLSPGDQSIVDRVTKRLLNSEGAIQMATQKAVIKLSDLVSEARETAMAAWQEAVAGMQWQMAPVPVTRSVSSADVISLGTMEKSVEKTRVKLNIGFHSHNDLLKIMVQVQDENRNPVAGVEVVLKEVERGIVLSIKTDEDGNVLNNAIKLDDGQYQVQVVCNDQIVETPIFKV